MNPNKTKQTYNRDFAKDYSTDYSIGALRCKVRFFTIVACFAPGCTVYTHLHSKGNIHQPHNDFAPYLDRIQAQWIGCERLGCNQRTR